MYTPWHCRRFCVWWLGLLAAGAIVLTGTRTAADYRFVPVDLSALTIPIEFDEYRAFVSPLPNGPITFLSHIPFAFSNTTYVHVVNSAVTVETNITHVKAVHFLVNSGGANPIRQAGDVIGSITLAFGNEDSITEQLKLGGNIREWRQMGDCGETINTLTSAVANVEYVGRSPNVCSASRSEGIAVIDRLTITLPKKYSTHATLGAITVVNTISDPPSILLNAITVERENGFGK